MSRAVFTSASAVQYSVLPLLSSHLRLLCAGPGFFRQIGCPRPAELTWRAYLSFSQLQDSRFTLPSSSLACYSGTGKNKIIAVHESGCCLYQ